MHFNLALEGLTLLSFTGKGSIQGRHEVDWVFSAEWVKAMLTGRGCCESVMTGGPVQHSMVFQLETGRSHQKSECRWRKWRQKDQREERPERMGNELVLQNQCDDRDSGTKMTHSTHL